MKKTTMSGERQAPIFPNNLSPWNIMATNEMINCVNEMK